MSNVPFYSTKYHPGPLLFTAKYQTKYHLKIVRTTGTLLLLVVRNIRNAGLKSVFFEHAIDFSIKERTKRKIINKCLLYSSYLHSNKNHITLDGIRSFTFFFLWTYPDKSIKYLCVFIDHTCSLVVNSSE